MLNMRHFIDSSKPVLFTSLFTSLSVIGVLFIPCSLLANEVSYYDALRIAADVSPTTQTAIARDNQQKSLLSVSQAGYKPKVGISINPSYSEFKDETSITPELTVTQTVYDFGRTRNQIAQVGAESKQVKAINNQELESIIANTSMAYIQAHRSLSAIQETKQHINDIEQVVKIANDRATAGAGNESDTTQAQARLVSAKLTASQIEGDYLQALESLKIYLNVPNALEVISMPDDLSDKANLTKPIRFEQIAEYRNQAAMLEISDAQFELAKSDSLPNVGVQLISNKTIEGTNPSTNEKYGHDNKIQLTMSYDIYQGGAATSRVSAAAANKEATKYQLQQLKQTLNQRLSTAKIAINQLESKQSLLNERINVLRKTRDIYKEQYTLGSRSILDVLNVEQEVYQAVVDKVNTDHDYWLAVSDYIFMSGQSADAFGLTILMSE
ncbi:TolC family protein [Thorsellia anophelis]|uniref:Outer membrane protein TolC n=1 Tax=Thorsellia anophelis DSM 18579 TaxID=1123402 RepID=A0A1I0DGV0_9GAMM|nr:TolC family protein [Thorsellia anophelis]SET31595.1 Outer membrane protein TolC [Thorsellia anophelis DSM 18579]